MPKKKRSCQIIQPDPIEFLLFCPKCKRSIEKTGTLHRHHIVARVDGGTDDPENIAYLCAGCHREWESFEMYHSSELDEKDKPKVSKKYKPISYEEWINLPSGNDLAVLYKVVQDNLYSDSVSVRQADSTLEELTDIVMACFVDRDFFDKLLRRNV